MESYIQDIRIDRLNDKWVLAGRWGSSELHQLQDNGTPLDQSDDIWIRRTPVDYVESAGINAIAFEPGEDLWIAHDEGIQYLELKR